MAGFYLYEDGKYFSLYKATIVDALRGLVGPKKIVRGHLIQQEGRYSTTE